MQGSGALGANPHRPSGSGPQLGLQTLIIRNFRRSGGARRGRRPRQRGGAGGSAPRPPPPPPTTATTTRCCPSPAGWEGVLQYPLPKVGWGGILSGWIINIIRRPSVWCVRPSIWGRVYPPPTPSLLTPWPANRPKTRKNSCFSSKFAQSTNPKVVRHYPRIARSHQKSEPFAQNGNGSAQSPNPLLKMAAGTPKVRTLCAKWQLERPKYEPCAQNTSWSVQGTT